MDVGVMVFVDVLVQFQCVFFYFCVVVVFQVIGVDVIVLCDLLCVGYVSQGELWIGFVQCGVVQVGVWGGLFEFFVVGEEEQFVFDDWVVQGYVVGFFFGEVFEWLVFWVVVELVVIMVGVVY